MCCLCMWLATSKFLSLDSPEQPDCQIESHFPLEKYLFTFFFGPFAAGSRESCDSSLPSLPAQLLVLVTSRALKSVAALNLASARCVITGH
jgi:hypothetical protein